MRNVFLALLFANLAYFAWARWVDVPRPPPVNETIARLPRLKLASELPPAHPAPGTPERTALNESSACLSVGPFADVENSTRAAGILRAKGFDPRPRAEAGATTRAYWVYIGGMKTDEDANRMLRRLQRLGFKDAQVMTDGGDPGRRVSLGLFNERVGADQRVWAARLKGIKADIAERNMPGTVYWIDMKALPGMGTVPIQQLLSQGLTSRIAVQPCSATPATKTTSSKDRLTPAGEPATAAISKVP